MCRLDGPGARFAPAFEGKNRAEVRASRLCLLDEPDPLPAKIRDGQALELPLILLDQRRLNLCNRTLGFSEVGFDLEPNIPSNCGLVEIKRVALLFQGDLRKKMRS